MTIVVFCRATVVTAAALALGACKFAAKPQPTHRGVYTHAGELDTFIPCGENKLYLVDGGAKEGLKRSYAEKSRRQFRPIYVELKAQVMPPADKAPVDGTDGYIRVDTVLTATSQVPLECRPKGSDPRDF